MCTPSYNYQKKESIPNISFNKKYNNIAYYGGRYIVCMSTNNGYSFIITLLRQGDGDIHKVVSVKNSDTIYFTSWQHPFMGGGGGIFLANYDGSNQQFYIQLLLTHFID